MNLVGLRNPIRIVLPREDDGTRRIETNQRDKSRVSLLRARDQDAQAEQQDRKESDHIDSEEELVCGHRTGTLDKDCPAQTLKSHDIHSQPNSQYRLLRDLSEKGVQSGNACFRKGQEYRNDPFGWPRLLLYRRVHRIRKLPLLRSLVSVRRRNQRRLIECRYICREVLRAC